MKVGFVNSATGVSAAPNQSIVGLDEGRGRPDQRQPAASTARWTIELLSKDDGSDVAKASAAVTQLIQQDKVDFILQPWVDFIAPVARGIEEKAGMPGVLSYAPQKGKETEAFKWTFSNAQGAKDNADALVKVFADKGWKNGGRGRRRAHHPAGDARLRRGDGPRRRHHVHQAQATSGRSTRRTSAASRPRSSLPVTRPKRTRSA